MPVCAICPLGTVCVHVPPPVPSPIWIVEHRQYVRETCGMDTGVFCATSTAEKAIAKAKENLDALSEGDSWFTIYSEWLDEGPFPNKPRHPHIHVDRRHRLVRDAAGGPTPLDRGR